MWFSYDLEGAFQIVLTGVFSGVGSAIGSYLAINYGITKLQRLLGRGGRQWQSSQSKRKTKK